MRFWLTTGSTVAKHRRPRDPADRKPGELVEGRNGGKIWRGTPKNQVAGPGRPPSELRARLRGSFEERIPVLEAIVDSPKSSAHEKVYALDKLAKYGLGPAVGEAKYDGALVMALAEEVKTVFPVELHAEALEELANRWLVVIDEFVRGKA